MPGLSHRQRPCFLRQNQHFSLTLLLIGYLIIAMRKAANKRQEYQEWGCSVVIQTVFFWGSEGVEGEILKSWTSGLEKTGRYFSYNFPDVPLGTLKVGTPTEMHSVREKFPHILFPTKLHGFHLFLLHDLLSLSMNLVRAGSNSSEFCPS